MKIGLISDTHIPDFHPEPPAEVAQAFAGVDLILHAGDIYSPSCLDWLERIAPVLACQGNGDFLRRIQDPRIRQTHLLSLHGLAIGLTHSIVLPENPPHATLERTMHRQFGKPVNVIVYGDTHVEALTTLKGVLLVNPGSPTLPHNLTHLLGTVGLLEIQDGQATSRILRLDPLEELDLTRGERWWSVPPRTG